MMKVESRQAWLVHSLHAVAIAARHLRRVFFLLLLLAVCLSSPGRFAVAAGSDGFSVSRYATILQTYVDDAGLVDYQSLKAQRQPLDDFVTALGNLDPKQYATWNDAAKIALWVNAYNAMVLKTVINHYPIKKRFTFVGYPLGIQHIKKVWKRKKHTVMGEKYSLDGIEHGILRKQFDEPRIHMALVCAAKSCPQLRREPYMAEKLEAQLKDQSESFLRSATKGFRLDAQKGEVSVSKIFKWFGKDFVSKFGTDQLFSHIGSKEKRSVLNFVGQHIDKANAEKLGQGKYSVRFFDYDWSLNDQKSAGGKG